MYNEMKPLVYDWATFTLSNGESDYDVSAEVATLFSNVPYAKHCVIFFNKEISVKFNNTALPAIVMGISRNPFQSPDAFLEIYNIYLTNASGSDATVEVLLW
jgi:hypothetical protein